MKTIAIVLAGAADQPAEELGGKTPLEVAKIPHLHALAKNGKVGTVRLMPDRWSALPDAALLAFFGYDADKIYTGRAPLEAADLGLKLEGNEVPFRVNFITESTGRLADATAGKISNREARALMNFLNKKLASDFVRFFPGSGHRHVAVIKDAHGFEALSAKTVSPHEVVGEPIEMHYPKGPGSELLKKLMSDAKLLLQDHEINQVRLDLHENPANMIWFWGQGCMIQLEKFNQEYGISSALISDAEYARGIARLAGMTVMAAGHPGEEEQAKTYEKISRQLLDASEEKDFVCLHMVDCDRASREGDLRAKISALEAADYFILSKVKQYMEKNKDVRILVTPAHISSWKQRKRLKEAVPFLMAGKNLMSGDTEKFTEIAARSSELKSKPADLLRLFIAHH